MKRKTNKPVAKPINRLCGWIIRLEDGQYLAFAKDELGAYRATVNSTATMKDLEAAEEAGTWEATMIELRDDTSIDLSPSRFSRSIGTS